LVLLFLECGMSQIHSTLGRGWREHSFLFVFF
jgi:hypothetical protein